MTLVRYFDFVYIWNMKHDGVDPYGNEIMVSSCYNGKAEREQKYKGTRSKVR